VAALIEQETGVQPELLEGKRGEFSVWVEDELVAQKDTRGFPSEDRVMAAVRKAMGSG
jgi:hypothetical protein